MRFINFLRIQVVSDIRKFKSHYPDWKQKYTLVDTLEEMAKENYNRWKV